MNNEQQQQRMEPTPQQRKDGNLDPITDAAGAHPVATGVGAAAGGAAGIVGGIAASAATGLATGTVLGGPVGAVAGLVVGGLVGGLAGKAVGEKIDPTAEAAYWREQYRNEPYYQAGESYEVYGPAYRTGYEGRARYAGKSFEEVEMDLQKDYDSHKGESKLSWDRAKAATRSAWNRLTSDDERMPKRGM